MSAKTVGGHMAGAPSAPKKATAEIQHLCDQVKKDFQTKTGCNAETFQAVDYTSQVVAGTNYFIKVKVGCEYFHIRVFQDLHHHVTLAGQKKAKFEEPLAYF